MPSEQVPAETLRKGMHFRTPDGLQTFVDLVHVDEGHNEVVVEYRSQGVTGTEVYPLGTMVPLL
ncbi:MAG TPA: hypothetical protein VFR17_08865 [Mycobacterium sp.]|nr:hypothetical protein [Mycobacterium sp.]